MTESFIRHSEIEITLTVLSKRERAAIAKEYPDDPVRPGTALLTFRGGKDTDLSAKDCEKIGKLFLKAAARLTKVNS